MTAPEITGEDLTLHGHRIRYRRAGNGPVVLLVHGMAGSSETWESVIPALARSATVIAPDLLGHGSSAKPRGDYSLGSLASHLRDLLVALGYDAATVVGHSLGGGIAMQFAYQFPERCERLVLVSSGGLGVEVNRLLRLLSIPGSEYVLAVGCADLLANGGNGVASFLAKIPLPATQRLAKVLRTYASLGDPETRTAFLHTLRSVVDTQGQRVSAVDRLYLAAHVPTLILWGDHDAFIPTTHAHAAHAALPESRLEIFEGAGHFPHQSEPERFAALLSEFIASTMPAAGTADFASVLARASGTLPSGPRQGATAK